MKNSTRYLFIVNPAAGRGRTKRLLPYIEFLIKELDIPYDIRLTSAPGEATDIAKRGIAEGFEFIVAVGGDGTTHEVVNGIIDSPATLGVISTGGGNDFPKAANIPLDVPRAVETLKKGRIRKLDVGLFAEQYFVNGLGIGLDGEVSHRYKRMKYLRGELGYLWGAINAALGFRGFETEIITQEWSYIGRVLLAGASNGPFQGGNFKLAPQARVDDGLLDIHIVQEMPRIKRLINMPKVRHGKHLHLKGVHIRQSTWIEIRTEESLPAHMDGEPFYLQPGKHKIEVLPGKLRVITS
jgi:diacylglycerol kinase (ATP)